MTTPAPHDDSTSLTPEEVEETCAAIVENAKDLTAEAAILLKEKRSARAFFLAGLAIEEAAKVPALRIASEQTERGETPDWARIRLMVRKHPQKLTYLTASFWVREIMAGSFIPDSTLVERVKWIEKNWMAKRNTAVYVEPFSPSRGVKPNDRITEKEAGMLFFLAVYVLDTLGSMTHTAAVIRANATRPRPDEGSFERQYAMLADMARSGSEDQELAQSLSRHLT
jgi:AbiV family abortive infection protein